jgi:ACS family tartrate transporter-like MFS transporter
MDKRYWRISFMSFIIYILFIMDRLNISMAATHMMKDLRFNPTAFGSASGIFFIGYLALQIPGALLAEKWSIRRLISISMVAWAGLALSQAFITSVNQLYVIRFLLGVSESPFFAGIIIYLNHWFLEKERAKATTFFMFGFPLSGLIVSPISGFIISRLGWRWMFALEGVVPLLLSVVVYLVFTDYPHQAGWLSEVEKRTLTKALEEETLAVEKRKKLATRDIFKNRAVWMLTIVYFFWMSAFYSFNFWLPTILKSFSNLDIFNIGLMTIAPYLAALLAMYFVARSSDRRGERKYHTAIPLLVGGLALLLSVLAKNQIVLSLIFLSISCAGLYSPFGPFWSLPSTFLTAEARASATGLINSANLGGFVGPYVIGYLATVTGSFLGGVSYVVCGLLVSTFLILGLGPATARLTTKAAETP